VKTPLTSKADNVRFFLPVGMETRSFELLTHIDVDRLLGEFDAEGHSKLLLRHINLA
jgi:hypothetical protein